MPRIMEVQSLELPELQPYRTLRRPLDHQRAGIFVAEGGKVVERMLASGIEVVSLLLTPEWLKQLSPSGEYPVYVAPQQLLESIVGYRLHQGIMAIGRIPRQPELNEFLAQAKRPWLLAALDGLVHAENVGVISRNAAAFGVQALLHDPTSSSPYLRRAVRNSMGAVFKLPVLEVEDLTSTLLHLQSRNVEVIAADPRGSEPLSDTNISGDVCIVLGHEGTGITGNVRRACTRSIAIPMQNDTDSLNVGSASAVLFYALAAKRL